MALLGAAGILVLCGGLVACEGPGPATTKTWCDRGNRLYSLDTEDTKGETLTVVPDSEDCPQEDSESVTIEPEPSPGPVPKSSRVLGDTVPHPDTKTVTRPVERPDWRLSPEAR